MKALLTSAFLTAALALLAPGAAAAQNVNAPLQLRASVTDSDGSITLGDLFSNAGAASGVVVGYRQGASAVLDAGRVQSLAGQAGVYWDNPRGLRRIIVASGPDGAPLASVQPASADTSAPETGALVVRRSESVSVTWSANGLSLTMSGTAQKDAAIGDVITVQNPVSKKLVDALVTGPGQAVSGPAADRIRSQMLLSSR